MKVIFTVTVKPATPPPNPTIITPAGGPLPDETVGVDVGVQTIATISGGVPPYSVKVTNGAIPDGQHLDLAADGISIQLSGAPTTPGDNSFELEALDSNGQ